MSAKTILFHFLAVVTVAITGHYFCVDESADYHRLSPQEIFFYRFLMAYIVMLTVSHRRIFSKSLRDEALLCRRECVAVRSISWLKTRPSA